MYIASSMILALLTIGIAGAQNSQTYPVRPIRLIVPFAPGGPNDVLGRMVGNKLTEQWGQPVVVENRGGAGGTLGVENGAKSAPDGYTLVMGSASNLAVAPGLYHSLTYRPMADLAPISIVAIVPAALAINARVPAKTVRDLIALAKTSADFLSYGSSGSGSMSHLTAEMFKAATGTQIVHVPYKGTSLALNDVISGQIDMMFADLASEVPHVQSLKLRILAVAASARSAAAPDVPTMVEAGVKNCEVDPWYGIVAPAGTPRDILAKLHGAIVAGLKSPDMRQRLDGLGYVVVGSSQEQFSIQLKVDIEKFARLIKNAGIKAGS